MRPCSDAYEKCPSSLRSTDSNLSSPANCLIYLGSCHRCVARQSLQYPRRTTGCCALMYWAAKSGAAGRSEVSVTPPPIVDKEAVTRHRRRCGEHALRSVPLGIISNVVSRARAYYTQLANCLRARDACKSHASGSASSTQQSARMSEHRRRARMQRRRSVLKPY